MSNFRSFDQEAYPNHTRVSRLKLKRTRKGRVLFSILSILVVLGILSYGLLAGADSLRGLFTGSDPEGSGGTGPDGSGTGTAVAKESRWHNIMLLGVDQRENEPARSDTLMVAMLDRENKTVRVISIPRDTRVKIEGLAYRTRINHAHSNGGAELTAKTVEQLLGIPVHNYVETNFRGFENIIDVLGGVELDVEKRMYYPQEDIDLRKGLQRLDGHDALSYVRFRSDGKGDLPRIERQHRFLRALAEEALQPGTVLKLPELAREVHRNVSTDLSLRDLLALTAKFGGVKPEDISFVNIPGAPEYINGASYYVVDEEKLQLLMEGILNPENPKTVPEEGEAN